MRVNPDQSIYHEADGAKDEFSRAELRRARLLLRRLRYLEQQARNSPPDAAVSGNGGAQFVEWEAEALEWVLGPDGIDFLAPVDPALARAS